MRGMRSKLLLGSLLLACDPGPPPAPPEQAPAPPPSATRDFDSDGFPDPRDRCPREAGIEPLGCPPPDSDSDKIRDPDDKCVGEAEVVNGFADADGCPDEIPKDLAQFIGAIKGLVFVNEKDTLKGKSPAILDRAAEVLKAYPDVRLEIVAHSDNVGDSVLAKDLSRARAEAVKAYLVTKGIDPARLETRGAGSDEPIDSNKTSSGRARNRRVEFGLLTQ
jgi:outer membrane protein OmpA-like peptidoglycan-associated protein